jgi:N-glycosylase/DNA lyase
MRTVPLTHQRVTIQDDFDLDKILESGQCFRPRKLADGRCRFVSGKALLYLTPLGCGQYDAAWYGAGWDVWAGYFDLGRSYAALRQSLAGQSAYLDAALAFGQGIRVLRQDPWEMLVTFIISQRKSIPAIRTAVEQLARCCGEPLCAEGDEVFLFPTPEQLCGLTEAQLTGCGLGYRTRYIQHAAAQAAAHADRDIDVVHGFAHNIT